MFTDTYRFTFDHAIPLPEAEETLQLTILAAEGLFGEATVRMDLNYTVVGRQRMFMFDGSTDVGSAVVRMFTALLIRAYGRDQFTVRRVGAAEPREKAA